MASASFEIKFKNIDHFHKENESEFALLPHKEFKLFELAHKGNKVLVINPSNKTNIASFSGEKMTYGYDQTEKYFKKLLC